MLGKVLILVTLATLSYGLRTETLIFEDEFDFLDFNKWKHEITLSGYGNWEFELYWNNRTTSFVKDGKLVIQPGLTADWIGENNVRAGYTMNLWGSTPADYCTANEFYGCERTSGAGGNFLNPITSARLS